MCRYDSCMPAWISVVVFALAVARVTRFITVDKLSEAPRDRAVTALWARTITDEDVTATYPNARDKRDFARMMARDRYSGGGAPPLGAYLLTCPWCVSIYVGAVAAPLCWFLGSNPWLFVPALACAFSQVTGMLAKIGD